MTRPLPFTAALRHVCMTLAALAIVLKVLIPPGTMIAAPSAGASFPLVLCTGHGPLTLDAAKDAAHDPAKAPVEKPAHDAPCTFAGHGVAAPAPTPLATGLVEFAAYTQARSVPVARDLAPGRGLAAPPLPARGPPSQIV